MKASTLVPPLTWLGRAGGTWHSRFWVRTWARMEGDSFRALAFHGRGRGGGFKVAVLHSTLEVESHLLCGPFGIFCRIFCRCFCP